MSTKRVETLIKKMPRMITWSVATLLILGMAVGLSACSVETSAEMTAEVTAVPKTSTEMTEVPEIPTEMTEVPETPIEMTEEPEKPESFVRKSGEYVTYPYQSTRFLESVPNDVAYGTDAACTSMQGMAASEKYLYVAKQKDNKYANIYQYDPATDEMTVMKYYRDLETTEQTALDCTGHCNDMTIYTDAGGQQYMIAATAYHPDSKNYQMPCLAQLQLDEENAELRLAGYFNLSRITSSGEKSYISASSIRLVAQTEEYHYFLMKAGLNFFWYKLPVGAIGGTWENPVEINCVQVFVIDTRNAVFVDKYGNLKTMSNLENWTNQGFFYSPEEDLLYVQYYNSDNGGFAGSENVIVTYDMEGRLTPQSLESVKERQDPKLFPTMLAFYLLDPWWEFFEIESCVLMRNQGDDGDLTLYFNTNAADLENKEGIWAYEYTRGSVDAQPIVDEDSVVYEIKYHYNVDGVPESEWQQKTKSVYYDMSRGSTHVKGIVTNLRINCYTKEDGVFMGWTMYRTSDSKWLYKDGNWYTEKEAPESTAKRIFRDAVSVDDLTDVNGDTIIAYAQWR